MATNIYRECSKDFVFETSRPSLWTTETVKSMGSACLYVGCSWRNVRLITIAECNKETLDIRDFKIRAMFQVITAIEAHIFCYVTPLSLVEGFKTFRSSVLLSKRQQPTPHTIKYLKILAYYAWPRTSSTKVTRKEKKSVTLARSPRNTSAQLRDRLSVRGSDFTLPWQRPIQC